MVLSTANAAGIIDIPRDVLGGTFSASGGGGYFIPTVEIF
jgi:hypothetical protein